MLISFQFLTVVLRRVTIAMCVSLAHSSHCTVTVAVGLARGEQKRHHRGSDQRKVVIVAAWGKYSQNQWSIVIELGYNIKDSCTI